MNPERETGIVPARSLRWDDALLEDEATVKAPLTGGDNRESALCALIEGEALNAKHRYVLACRTIDGLLHLALHRRHSVRVADHFHAARRIGNERVERHH